VDEHESFACFVNQVVEFAKIEQNALDASLDDRKTRTHEVLMASRSTPHCLGTIAALGAFFLATSVVLSQPALAPAQQQPQKADGVFDDDKKNAETKSAPVSDRDTIGFSQENAAAQMNELEERMFRLSEALRGLEPENAARLRLALKFSREEQILEQMRETHKLLKEAQLSKAETEVKELIAKLEHLRNLLLAEDLDFQLKLARLRQMRETLGQLERIVKEERRDLGWCRFATEQRKRHERLTTRRPDLEALVRDQEGVLAAARETSKNEEPAAKNKRAAIRERAVKLRSAVTGLANDPLFADLQPPHLRRADNQLAEAVTSLEQGNASAALGAAEKALASMREELTRLDEQVAQTERTISETEFRRRQEDQSKNREATDRLGETSARLGDVGVALRKDLIRASAAMRTAAQSLGKSALGPAADDQSSALEVLAKSRDDFLQSVERLLVELRTELRSRLVFDLNELHEFQSSIRETTQAQAPRVLQKSRTALVSVAGLSKKEAELGERMEHLLALVEETEYGIALPTTLRILGREMRSIEGWLKSGDVAPRTLAFETRIEEDVVKLLQAIRRLPPQTPAPPGTLNSLEGREQERELNRMIAELTMVRMLQARLNDDTIGVDKSRPSAATLPPAVRREVETLEATQDEIRDALAKMAERLDFPEDIQQ
jgi:hypothetical protein